MMLFRARSDNPHLINATRGAADFAAGNTRYLIEDPARPVQLRPRLPEERNPSNPEPDNGLIIYREHGSLLGASFVSVPADRLDNTAANLELALRDLARFEPRIVALYRSAIARAAAKSAVKRKPGR